MTNRGSFLVVERAPCKVSGAWVFAGTWIRLSALYEDFAGGARVQDFVTWFPSVDAKQVRAVLDHEVGALRTPTAG